MKTLFTVLFVLAAFAVAAQEEAAGGFPDWKQNGNNWSRFAMAWKSLTGTNSPSNPTTNGVMNGYHGGVVTPDGNVQMIPYTALGLVTFNPVTKAFTTNGVMRSYNGGVVTPDGNVQMIPENALGLVTFNGTKRCPPNFSTSRYFNKY